MPPKKLFFKAIQVSRPITLVPGFARQMLRYHIEAITNSSHLRSIPAQAIQGEESYSHFNPVKAHKNGPFFFKNKT